MGILELISALIKTFIIIFPGYILKKKGILTKQYTEGLSSIITYITYPCLVINAMQREFSMEMCIRDRCGRSDFYRNHWAD